MVAVPVLVPDVSLGRRDGSPRAPPVVRVALNRRRPTSYVLTVSYAHSDSCGPFTGVWRRCCLLLSGLVSPLGDVQLPLRSCGRAASPVTCRDGAALLLASARCRARMADSGWAGQHSLIANYWLSVVYYLWYECLCMRVRRFVSVFAIFVC